MGKTENRLLQLIRDEVLKRQYRADNSLMAGSCGRILFLSHYYLSTEDAQVKDVLYDLIGKVSEDITNYGSSIATGPAGVGWCFLHLRDAGLVDFEDDDVLAEIDKEVIRATVEQLGQGNFDFLHGALGQGLYLLKRLESSSCTAMLEDIIKKLDDTKILTAHGIYWNGFDSSDLVLIENCNLGLAHGMPGFLMFLEKCQKAGVLREITTGLLKSCRENLISSKSTYPVNGCYFENHVSYSSPVDRSGSRLGWCYGDLTIGLTLLNLEGSQYRDIAIDVIKQSTTRRTFETTQVKDDFLCHGSAGLAYIYHRCGEMTNERTFYETSGYWLDVLSGRLENGLELLPDGLLEGIDGIGLCLLGLEKVKSNNVWDECLLLS